MKAFYVENNSGDAILIPDTNQIWWGVSSKELELFASCDPSFKDWEQAEEKSLTGVSSNITSVRRYWEVSPECLVIAESDDDGNLKVYDIDAWERCVEREEANIPKSAACAVSD